jgi:hypothetical protein
MARIYGEQDRTILRFWSQERIELSSPLAQYYSLILGGAVDPLHHEPVGDPMYGGTSPTAQHDEAWKFDGPRDVVLAIIFERATGASTEAGEAGVETTCDGEAYLNRNEWERVWPDRLPKKGDVFWSSSEWWDVVGCDTGGHVLDSGHYVEFKLRLRKRDRFTPDRKI